MQSWLMQDNDLMLIVAEMTDLLMSRQQFLASDLELPPTDGDFEVLGLKSAYEKACFRAVLLEEIHRKMVLLQSDATAASSK